MRGIVFFRTRTLKVAGALVAGLLLSGASGVAGLAAKDRASLLLLPIASGTPGQEWSAKALGGILEDGFGSVRSVRLVAGTAREAALRELSASDTVTPEAFRDICRRAGADLAVLGGSTLVEGRLALEIRVFHVATARELPSFHGDEPLARGFNLVEAAVRHVAAEAALDIPETLFPGGVTVSLEAYAAYRAALLEESAPARVEKLRGVLELDGNYAEPARRLGVELFRQGSLDEALGVLERAVALGPKVTEARNNFGVALAAAGRKEQAQREFEEAVALAPDYAEARLNLARVFEDQGNFSNAEKQYTAVLEADAGNDKARAGLAALYDRTGRPELAVTEFRRLSARRPDLAEADFIRSGQEARKAREYPRAEKFFLRAADINPQFAQTWAELGTNSYLAGEYPKGVEYFRKALTLDPGQASYHYYLGLALDKGRQQDEALREYRRAVELGGPPEARLGLARAALESGDPGLAVEELNRLLVASPDHAEAKILLAQATGEMEARRRLVEGQSQFANQRLARLEQIVADTNRVNRELEARLQSVTQEKRLLEQQTLSDREAAQGGLKEPSPAVTGKPAIADDGSTAEAVARDKARAEQLERDVERLERELAAERDARRREGAEAQAALALLRTDQERNGQLLAEGRERLKSEAERFQTELAAAQAKILELGRGSGEVAEMRQRLVGLQADLSKAQTGIGQERKTFLQEESRLKTELAAEREARRVEAERFKAELGASEVARNGLAKQVIDAAELKGRLLAAQASSAKAEEAQQAERVRGERALAAEREERQAEVQKLRAELADGRFKVQEQDRLLLDLAAIKTQALSAQAALEKVERAVAAEREKAAAAQAAERASRQSEIEKLKADLAAAQEKAERAVAAERERGETIVAKEREESRRQIAQVTTRIGALEAQVKTQAGNLQARESELTAALARESSVVAQHAKGQAELEMLAERQAALETRAVAQSRTLAERERALEQARLSVRDLALEFGRNALRMQSWEKARGYFEQAAEADPRSGEAWYGLGEALFRLGQYEKSKQMYDKAKEIY
ncbi:MAG: tetratricopeptide repeat protein [Candidatus Methylomirabilia bacterium]